MAVVRAKFVCQSKEHDTNDPELGQVRLHVVTSGSPENESFFKHTPSGQLTLGILNPGAFAFFELGKEYMIDIIPATEAT